MASHLQVGEHAQKAPQQTAVDRLSVPLPLDEQQDPVNGFTLDLQITDDVEPEQLQAHVPADKSSLLNTHFWQKPSSHHCGAADNSDHSPDGWQHWIL